MGDAPRDLTWSEIFGERVRQRRLARGWTQAELGERIERSRYYVLDIEQGKSNLSVQILLELAFALGVSPSELVDGLLPHGALRLSIRWPDPPGTPHES